MNYENLNDRAKERARDKFRELDYWWWDNVYESVEHEGKLIGIDIDVKYRTSEGKQVREGLDISFSGFCSQGDGCCFGGTLYVKTMKEAIDNLEKEGIKSVGLKDLAEWAVSLYNETAAGWTAEKLKGEEVDLGDIDNGVFNIMGTDRYWRTKVDFGELEEPDMWFSSLEKQYNEFVSSFAAYIYSQLEAEYDYLTSDECIEELIKTSNFDFTEKGEWNGHT